MYKALRPGAHPRDETVKAVLKAVGVEMTFKQFPEAEPDPLDVGPDVASIISPAKNAV